MGRILELGTLAPFSVTGQEPAAPAVQRKGLVDKVTQIFLPQAGIVLGGHDKLPATKGEVQVLGGFRPVRSRLAALGVSVPDLDRVFNHRGEIPGQNTSSIDIYGFPLQELPVVDGWLRGRLTPAYGLIDPSLSERRPGGTNLHGTPHADAVTEYTVNFLRYAGADALTQRRGLIAARIHDLGNFISRDYHAFISPEIASRLVPEVLDSPQDWGIIQDAVFFHDTDSIREAAPELLDLPATDMIKWMRELGPEANALFLADKTDVGRQRVNTIEFKPEEGYDRHTELNLLSRTNAINLSDDGKKLVWDIDFNPIMFEEESRRLPHLSRSRSDHEGNRALVSDRMHKLHREYGTSHFDTWKRDFWELYLARTRLAACAAFALFPNMETFEIRMSDSEGREDSVHHIRKDDIDGFFEQKKLKHMPKEMRRTQEEPWQHSH